MDLRLPIGFGHSHNIKMSKSTVEKPTAAPLWERAAGCSAEQPLWAAFDNSIPSQTKVKEATASTSRDNDMVKRS